MLEYILDTARQPLPQDDYTITEAKDGRDSISFTLLRTDPSAALLQERARVLETTTNQTYCVSGVDAGQTKITYLLEKDLSDFRRKVYTGYTNGSASATAHDTILGVLPGGWTLVDAQTSAIQAYLSMQGPTALDVIDQCAETYGCYPVYDTAKKTVTLHYPAQESLTSAFLIDTANLRAQPEYKGKSGSLVTRLYPQGADSLSISDVNGGVAYVECHDYTDEILAGYWRDDRYTSAEHLLAAAREKVKTLAQPERTWSLSVVDLHAIDAASWPGLELPMFAVVTLIDRTRGLKMSAQIIEKRTKPYYPAQNELSVSTGKPSFTGVGILRRLNAGTLYDELQITVDQAKAEAETASGGATNAQFAADAANSTAEAAKTAAAEAAAKADAAKTAADAAASAAADASTLASSAQTAAETVKSDVTAISTRQSNVETTVSGLTSSVSALTVDVSGNKADISTLSGTVTTVSETADSLKTRVTAVESGVAANSSSITQLADGISLTVTGGVGGTAQISLTVNGTTKTGYIVLTGDVLADSISVAKLMAKDLTATGKFQVDNGCWSLTQSDTGLVVSSNPEDPLGVAMLRLCQNDILLKNLYNGVTASVALGDGDVTITGLTTVTGGLCADSLTVGGSALTDFVVSEGTSGIWTYRKWQSGLAECWGTATLSASITRAWGSLYISDSKTVSYPFTFSAKPTVLSQCATGFVSSVVTNDDNCTTSAYACYFVNGISYSSAMSHKLHILARGRWK